MGIIAFDGTELATDSQSTCQHLRRAGTTRKLWVAGDWDNWKVEGKKALAFAYWGEGAPGPWILQALTEDLRHNSKLDVAVLSFEALIVTEDALFCWKFKKDGRGDEGINELLPIAAPAALGTGAALAIGVMSVGKSAKTAVEIAIKFDIHSGGLIQNWSRENPEAVYKELEILKRDFLSMMGAKKGKDGVSFENKNRGLKVLTAAWDEFQRINAIPAATIAEKKDRIAKIKALFKAIEDDIVVASVTTF